MRFACYATKTERDLAAGTDPPASMEASTTSSWSPTLWTRPPPSSSRARSPPRRARTWRRRSPACTTQHAGIHRDLKPANILVSQSVVPPATPYGIIRLCDFGLARVDASAAEQAKQQDAATQIDNEGDSGDEMEGGSADAVSKAPPMLRKQMTTYVVTRWYRARGPARATPPRSTCGPWAASLEMLGSTRRRASARRLPGRYCIASPLTTTSVSASATTSLPSSRASSVSRPRQR